MKSFTICMMICLMAFVNLLPAQVPQTMSYQGILTDDTGQPVANGDYAITFRIYDVSKRGAAIWEEIQTIPVTDGLFNAILGCSDTLFISFDKPYWLGISIAGGSELTPRIELTSSAYSLNARQVKGINNVFPGEGWVGIGTKFPQYKLHM